MQQINEEKLGALANKVVTDISGAMGVLMGYIGDQTGVYRAMADGHKRSADEIAEIANVDPRYLREWLSANAALGYIDLDPAGEHFQLSPEQIELFADEDSPYNLQGFIQATVAQHTTHDKATEVFKSGVGREWGDQHACLICGTDRLFKHGYRAMLTSTWIPALDQIEQKLDEGGSVIDIGCGIGSSTLIMAERFPRSKVVGVDLHNPSIEQAQQNAEEAGLKNVVFDVVSSTEIRDEQGYDLACVFDSLHDMGDPVGAARNARKLLKPGGVFMVVEPLAGDTLKENLSPLNAIFYAASTVACLPSSRSQSVGRCLGAQAGPAQLKSVLHEAGFTSVEVVCETPTNLVIQAKG